MNETLEKDLALYLVTSREGLSDHAFLQVIELACQNGVSMVQLREKTATTREFYDLALKVRDITTTYKVPLIINDRVDICLAVDADGVHIGDSELPVYVTRQLIGSKKILGVSTKSVLQSQQAQEEGADYLGIGTIYPTTTKHDTQSISMSELTEMVDSVSIPVVAIGGIKEVNIMTFQNTGISGVAIVSDIMQSRDVSKKVIALNQLIQEVRGDGSC